MERPAQGLEPSNRCPEAAGDWSEVGMWEDSRMGAAGGCRREPIQLRRVFWAGITCSKSTCWGRHREGRGSLAGASPPRDRSLDLYEPRGGVADIQVTGIHLLRSRAAHLWEVPCAYEQRQELLPRDPPFQTRPPTNPPNRKTGKCRLSPVYRDRPPCGGRFERYGLMLPASQNRVGQDARAQQQRGSGQ